MGEKRRVHKFSTRKPVT